MRFCQSPISAPTSVKPAFDASKGSLYGASYGTYEFVECLVGFCQGVISCGFVHDAIDKAVLPEAVPIFL